jgi:hypothetical protein
LQHFAFLYRVYPLSKPKYQFKQYLSNNFFEEIIQKKECFVLICISTRGQFIAKAETAEENFTYFLSPSLKLQECIALIFHFSKKIGRIAFDVEDFLFAPFLLILESRPRIREKRAYRQTYIKQNEDKLFYAQHEKNSGNQHYYPDLKMTELFLHILRKKLKIILFVGEDRELKVSGLLRYENRIIIEEMNMIISIYCSLNDE